MHFLFSLLSLPLYALHTHAIEPRGFIPPKVDPNVEPVPVAPIDPVPAPAPESPNQPVSGCRIGEDCSGDSNPVPGKPIYNPPPAKNPDPPSNGASDVASHISDILDLVTSIISLAQGGSTITTSATLPTAAYPCASAQNVYGSCSSASSNFGAQALSAQASCLCYEQVRFDISYNPGAFDGYIRRCNSFVLGQTSISTQASGLVPALGLCPSVGDVRATATGSGAVASATSSTTGSPALPGSGSATTASTPTVQPSTTSGARRGVACGSLLVVVGLVLGSALI